MPTAARVGDITSHGGTIIGPGSPSVLVGGMPAAVAGDTHVCPIPPNTPHLTTSSFPAGSLTVMVGGKPALRSGDMALCGASVVVGCPTVNIG